MTAPQETAPSSTALIVGFICGAIGFFIDGSVTGGKGGLAGLSIGFLLGFLGSTVALIAAATRGHLGQEGIVKEPDRVIECPVCGTHLHLHTIVTYEPALSQTDPDRQEPN